MAVAINNSQRAPSTLDKIAKAASIAHEVFGIPQALLGMKHLSAQTDLEQQQEATQQAAAERAAKDYTAQNDPMNPAAESARQSNSLMLDLIAKRGDASPQTIQTLKDNMQGHAAVPAVPAIPALGPQEESGALAKGGIAGVDAIPAKSPMSMAQMKMALPEDAGLIGLVKSDLAARAAGAKNSTFADKNGIAVAKDYEDKLKTYTGLQNDISKVESALQTKDKNGNPLITSQQLGDANAAMARIFSPSHMSDSTVNRTEYESYPAKFSAALQKLSADPQDIGSRDLVNHIIDQAHHIGNVSNENGLKDLAGLDAGYQELSNPDTQRVASSKSGFYKTRLGKRYHTIGENVGNEANSSGGGLPGMNSANANSGSAPHPQDSAAVDWAKSNPKDPRAAKILQLNGM